MGVGEHSLDHEDVRAKYIRDLVIRGRSKHTQESYTRYVCDLARYYRRSPELISYEEVSGWQAGQRFLVACRNHIGTNKIDGIYHQPW
jgi:hypothetical protein